MRVAVLGASGYTGLELLRILVRHPHMELTAVTSEQRAGRAVAEAFPSLAGLVDLRFESADASALAEKADLVFAALPHSASAVRVRELRKAGVAVVDLSADFRLRDLDAYRSRYGEHQAPELLGTAVYGLPEIHREALRGADLVAAAGCYPTAVLLPLLPFLRQGLIDSSSIWVDAKSGISGAGRKLDEAYLFAELDANCMAYQVGEAHRHVPEMEQEAGALAGSPVQISFVPYLLPTIRGIVASIFVRPLDARALGSAREVLQTAFADEPFVRLLPPGVTPSLAAVRGSNFCDVAAFADERTGTLILLSALDNLVKGASGQAVQCANLMRGLPETEGLMEAPLVP